MQLEHIRQACLEAAALLPRQGPITKFAFLNPLQGLEHVHFDEVMAHVGGAASDLRPGLPWQGVDIHEPVRLLFIIEATTQTLLKLMEENSILKNIFRNHWSHLAAIDPHTNQVYRFSKDRFVLFQPATGEPDPERLATAPQSQDWYQGKREHLPFALIQSPSKLGTTDDATVAGQIRSQELSS